MALPEPNDCIFVEGVKRVGQQGDGAMIFIDIAGFGADVGLLRLLFQHQQLQNLLVALNQAGQMADAERNKGKAPDQMHQEPTMEVTSFQLGKAFSGDIIPMRLGFHTGSKLALTLSLHQAEAISESLRQEVQKLRQKSPGPRH